MGVPRQSHKDGVLGHELIQLVHDVAVHGIAVIILQTATPAKQVSGKAGIALLRATRSPPENLIVPIQLPAIASASGWRNGPYE
jgi:hypothetical protein